MVLFRLNIDPILRRFVTTMITGLAAAMVGSCSGSWTAISKSPLTLKGLPWSRADMSELTVVGFNVESGDAAPAYLARNHIAPMSGVDLWGLSEVENERWLQVLERGAEAGEQAPYGAILGSTGGSDRLAILYNEALLQLVTVDEMGELSFGGRVRAPLVAQFQIRGTSQRFLFMVNHLYRSKAENRHQQARWLNQWVRSLSLPVVAVGDYNFDVDVVDGAAAQWDAGFDLMTAEDAFAWVRPQPLVPTYCSDRYSSILDFVFVANGAARWPVTSTDVVYSDLDYCPDTVVQSDHLPVRVTFDVSSVASNYP